MPCYFLPHDLCFCVTVPPHSTWWGEIGKRVAVLESGRFSLVFADKVCRAFYPTWLDFVTMPSAPPAPRASTRQSTRQGRSGGGAQVRDHPVGRPAADDPVPVVAWLVSPRSCPRNPAVAPLAEEVPDPEIAEDDTSNDNHPLTNEEQYQRALREVALAFSDFLYWAMLTEWGRSLVVVNTITRISQLLSESGEEEESSNSNLGNMSYDEDPLKLVKSDRNLVYLLL